MLLGLTCSFRKVEIFLACLLRKYPRHSYFFAGLVDACNLLTVEQTDLLLNGILILIKKSSLQLNNERKNKEWHDLFVTSC